jgi:hypothetical protein
MVPPNLMLMEDVPLAAELRGGVPVSELSQAGDAATSDAAVAMGGLQGRGGSAATDCLLTRDRARVLILMAWTQRPRRSRFGACALRSGGDSSRSPAGLIWRS